MQTSTLFDNYKEDQYFRQSENELHKLHVDTTSQNKRFTESKPSVKPERSKFHQAHQVPINSLYSLHTKASVHQDVAIQVNKSNSIHTNGLLDSGSKTNLVLQKLVKQLNLPTPPMTSIS